jgi:hypothetical protein
MRRKRHFERPSAALIVSSLALFVALGGVGAIASGVLTTKKVNKIAKKQVIALAPGLSVASANNANTLGGAGLGSLTVGRSVNSFACDPADDSATFAANCGTVNLTLPRSGRVLINAGATWRSTSGAPNEGTCRLTADGNEIPDTRVRYGQAINTFATVDERAGLAINTITGVLGAGPHALVLQCNSTVGGTAFADDSLTAVMIGTD